MRPAGVAAIVAAMAVSITAADRLRDTLAGRIRKIAETSDVYPLPPPEYVRVATLGYRDAAASVLWASTLYQYGDRVSHNRRFEYPTQYVETILELDPAFRPAYTFISTLTAMQVVAPTREQLDRTEKILETGTRELPHDAQVWGSYAAFLMFEGAQYLNETDRTRWRVKGARAAQRAVELGYFMESIALTGAIFLERAGERDLAIKQLERAYAVAPSEETRERIAAKLKKLHAQEGIARIQAVQQAALTTWKDQFPWLNESTFVLVGIHHDAARCAGLAGLNESCTPGWTGFAAGAR